MEILKISSILLQFPKQNIPCGYYTCITFYQIKIHDAAGLISKEGMNF
jgi:hypothetical protein